MACLKYFVLSIRRQKSSFLKFNYILRLSILVLNLTFIVFFSLWVSLTKFAGEQDKKTLASFRFMKIIKNNRVENFLWTTYMILH